MFKQIKRVIKSLKLFKRAYKKYSLKLVVLTFLGILGGLLEGIGANTLIPLFSIFVYDNGSTNNPITEATKNFFNFLHIDFSLKQILIFLSLLFILKAIILIISMFIRLKVTADYEEDARNSLFQKTLKSNWPHLLKQKIGNLDNIIKIDITNSAALLQGISDIFISLANLAVYSFVAINISFEITAITLVLGLILLLLSKPIMRSSRKTSRKIVKANSDMSHFVNENILGIKTIKTMFKENTISNLGESIFENYKKARVKVLFLKNIVGPIMQPISLIFICFIFAFSYKTASFQFANMIAIIYLIKQMFSHIQTLQAKIHFISENIPYLQNVLKHEEENKLNKETNNGLKKFNFKKELEFKNITFSYNTNKNVLNNINFKIKKGEMVGLIGQSGAGKTTIVDLILRLFTPEKGKIFLDEENISNFSLKEWRENIGYVSQDIFLKNDTIENNIKFYNDSITKEDMERVAKMANIHDFVQKLPNKFSTEIGEKGVLLSAGQRQRIVMARILAKNPKFLILDEATSALDNESEIQIQKVIENLKGKITVLVIAHRLSTIINSDELLVIEDGEIKEHGSPKKLLKDTSSYFYKVYNIRE